MNILFSRLLRPALVAVAGVALILILNIPVLNSAFKNTVYFALAPMQKNLWQAGAGVYDFFEPLLKINSLADENKRLRERVNDLMGRNAVIEDLKKENEFLRQGLNLELDKDFDLKIVQIVGKDGANDILIIDKGGKDMIEAGMPVITEGKALVGKVSKTYDNFSEITLVTQNDFSFDVKIGDDAIDGLVRGRGGYCAGIDLVPKDKDLKVGQKIITSMLGGIFPAGLLVGTIKEVYKNDVETFQSAKIETSFDIGAAQQVFVAVGKYPFELEASAVSIIPNRQ
jgi:rod shape-determining protein MreC